jgi:hypothetical protein
LIQRFTPLAWVFIGVFAVTLLLGIAGCVMTLVDRPTDEVWDPTATSTSEPTGASASAASPSLTPTPWYQEIVTSTVVATETVTASGVVTEPGPVWWSEEMTEDDERNLLPPQEVQDAVWDAFIAGLGCYNIADRETIPDASLEELTRKATKHLEDHPDVVRGACNGFASFEELNARMERLPLIRLVEFGPRNKVTCNYSPTRCATAVSLQAQGAIWWHEPTCTDRGYETPCVLRLDTGEMVDHGPNRFYYAELKYDQGSSQWRIVYLEVSEL